MLPAAESGPYKGKLKSYHTRKFNTLKNELYQKFQPNKPLLTLRPRLLLTRKGSITLKCLEVNGCP